MPSGIAPTDVPAFRLEGRPPTLSESLPLELRRAWLRLRWGRRLELGPGAYVGPGVRFELAREAHVTLGRGAWLGARATVRARGPVSFGAGTLVGPGSSIVAERGVEVGDGCILGDEVMLNDARVGDAARIGARACLLAGADVGPESMVLARSVVQGRVRPGASFEGVPLRPAGVPRGARGA
jgi:acetyltransferase-like isoleucine patch superfamily enzyme